MGTSWIIIEILRKVSDMLDSQRGIEERLGRVEGKVDRFEGKLDRLQATVDQLTVKVDEGNRLALENNKILVELQDQLVIGKAVELRLTAGPVVEQ